MIPKKWTIRPADPSLVHEMADRLKISAPVAQILVSRGFETPEAAYAFLNPGRARLHDPFLFKDMQPAVERLAQARDAKEKVLIYGDYDVDGITATSLLFQTMAALGFDLDYFIPNRFDEGYGLNPAPLKRAKEAGFSLVVTVDCGSKEVEAAQFARDAGLDLIVTDHHIPDSSTKPPAVAFLNPMRPDGGYPDTNLCGAAVAFKLAQGLTQHLGGDPAELDRHLDLVAMGTVADVAPLLGENRSLVRLGLQRLRQTDRPGIRALLDATRVVQQKIGVRQIGFQLAPRINALGRLGKAAGAVRLLVTEKDEEAVEIAEIMNEANSERQRLQEKVVTDIRKTANAEPDRFTAPVIVLSHPDWHRGVIGIAASKVVDWHYRPAVLFSIEDGIAHGSARSIPGIDITRALEQCSDLLERFGGHALAAGVTVQADRLPTLRRRLEKIVGEMEEGQDLEPHLEIDAEVRLDEIDEALVNQLADMGPFGTGKSTTGAGGTRCRCWRHSSDRGQWIAQNDGCAGKQPARRDRFRTKRQVGLSRSEPPRSGLLSGNQ